MAKDPRIVVMGGGTGSFVVLSALKKHTKNLTAIVNMADDGGSTGVLRDELGVLPAGDVRQCLVALSRSPKMRDLFTFRIPDGSMKGHAFGNIFLATLESMTGSFRETLATASELLNISGEIQPVTYDSITLVLRDGEERIVGEDTIGHYALKHRHPKLSLTPRSTANKAALAAIKNADLVVIAPGDLYTSIAPLLLVPGVANSLAETRAKVVYVANLINKPDHTEGFSVKMYAEELERIGGAEFIDYCVYNTDMPSQELLNFYAKDGELPVREDKARQAHSHFKFIGTPLLARAPAVKAINGDALANDRSLIRHSPHLLAEAILKIV